MYEGKNLAPRELFEKLGSIPAFVSDLHTRLGQSERD